MAQDIAPEIQADEEILEAPERGSAEELLDAVQTGIQQDRQRREQAAGMAGLQDRFKTLTAFINSSSRARSRRGSSL